MTERLGAGEADLARAAELLIGGALVGLPTETVYGLAVRADDVEAVERLYLAKGRPSENPLIVHVAAVEDLQGVVLAVTPLAARLLEHFAPGPLTVVLDAHPDLPRAVTGGLDTVAVRIPDHPVALEVLRRCRLPLAAPSANRSGRPSPTCAAHVHDDLDGRIAAVVDAGPTRLGLESTVVDARGSRATVLRDGAVSREDIERACEGLPVDTTGVLAPASPSSRPHAPGTRHPHYAPSLPVHIAAPGTGALAAASVLAGLGGSLGRATKVGLVTCGPRTVAAAARPTDGVVLLADLPDAGALASQLFAVLRRAEDRGLAALVIEGVAAVGIGRAVMDRLHRAAQASGGTLGAGTAPAAGED